MLLLEIVLIICAYLLGSVANAVIVCRLLNLPDPRTQGSNNAGTTNVLRIAGKKAAIITLLADTLKGGVPVVIARYLEFDLWVASLVGLGAFIGHIYPIWFGFRGGKGMATFLGILLGLNFYTGLCSALTWLVVAKGVKISSLAALVATLLSPFYFYYFVADISSGLIIVLMSIWIFWRHRTNIKRLINQKEVKIK